jgi:histone deacetylase 1/2
MPQTDPSADETAQSLGSTEISSAGSSTTASSRVAPASPAPAPHCPVTGLQQGISKPKTYTDGIVGSCLHARVPTGEPETLGEALASKERTAAMDSEYQALMKNKTWHLVPRPKGKNIVGCKWVYKIKRRADGTVDRYKARLVAKGFK